MYLHSVSKKVIYLFLLHNSKLKSTKQIQGRTDLHRIYDIYFTACNLLKRILKSNRRSYNTAQSKKYFQCCHRGHGCRHLKFNREVLQAQFSWEHFGRCRLYSRSNPAMSRPCCWVHPAPLPGCSAGAPAAWSRSCCSHWGSISALSNHQICKTASGDTNPAI